MKIAVVIPWFSNSNMGGAEIFAGGIARSLQEQGADVELFTTCGKDSFAPWDENYYEEGESEVEGVKVRRFKLRKRNKMLYEELLGKLIDEHELSYVEQMQILANTVNSDSMLTYIYENKNQYVYLFIPYLYGTTYFGAKMAPENSFIIPCMHDESMGYFETIGDMLSVSSGVLYNTLEEQIFTEKVHNITKSRSIVSGGGVVLNATPNINVFKEKYNIDYDYLIYVGRQVTGKNVPQLIEYYNRYCEETNSNVKLLFVGQGEEQVINMVNNSKNVVRIGELDEQDKVSAIAGSLALIQPSLLESFSIVIMESWLCEVPIVVHKLCAVTNGHCDRSGGGFSYETFEDFTNAINLLVSMTHSERSDIGKKGNSYVQRYYTWEKTADRIFAFLEDRGYRKEVFMS